MPKEDKDRLRDEAIQGAGDEGEFAAGNGFAIWAWLKVEGEEEIGLNNLGIVGIHETEIESTVGGLADFCIGELEKEVNGPPSVDERIFAGEKALGIERAAEFGYGIDGEGAVGFVAERSEKADGQFIERSVTGKGGEGGMDIGMRIRHGSSL
jgi:hypothetical protein